MKKKTKDNVTILYDDNKINIEFVEENNRLNINPALPSWKKVSFKKDELTFVSAFIDDNRTNCVIARKNSYSEGKHILHHIFDEFCPCCIKKDIECENADMLSYNLYQFSKDNNWYLYNLHKISEPYSYIYRNKYRAGSKTIIVKERLCAFLNSEVYDDITYGIDTETYKINTNIWSELQQRFIPMPIDNDNEVINNEIVKYLEYLSRILYQGDRTYEKDFIRQLKNTSKH